MTDIPVIMTSAGAQPTPPATLLADLIATVTATNPGFTATLPGSLIEDVTSTQVAGLAMMDSARVDTINSVTPYGANDFLLLELGAIYLGDGAAPAVPTNTSTFVIFTAVDSNHAALGGVVIPVGFTVSDGTYQYVVQDGGVTAASGQTVQLFVVATIAGTWAVPTNSVNQLVTAAPPGVTLTVTNPVAGTSGASAETATQFRARVLQAGLAVATGTEELLKTLLGLVPGIQQRLISVRQQSNGWEVLSGGGDPYLTAGAIYASGVDVSRLIGSQLLVTNVTNANPGVVTTNLNHGFTTGQTGVQINGMIGMNQLNGVNLTVTVVDEKHFSVGINTTSYTPYFSGGIVTPNLRNQSVNILNYPDTYTVVYVAPPQQTVTMTVTYNTTAPNFTSQAAVAQLAAPAIAAYVNSVVVGQPMNLNVMASTFAAAIQTVLDPSLISSLTFAVFINGVATSPVGLLIFGDPESSFEALTAGITVIQAS